MTDTKSASPAPDTPEPSVPQEEPSAEVSAPPDEDRATASGEAPVGVDAPEAEVADAPAADEDATAEADLEAGAVDTDVETPADKTAETPPTDEAPATESPGGEMAAEVEAHVEVEVEAQTEPEASPAVDATSGTQDEIETQEAPIEEAPIKEVPVEPAPLDEAPLDATEAPAAPQAVGEVTEVVLETVDSEAIVEAVATAVIEEKPAPAEKAESATELEAQSQTQPEAPPETPAGTEPAATPAVAAPPPVEKEEIRALRQAKDDQETVTGRVIGWNNGGFHVLIDGVTAFCPRSEMEIGHAGPPQQYLEKSFDFQVLKVQKRGRRIVLSRSALLKTERSAARAEVKKGLEAGTVLTGQVASLTDFGAFVELGGGIQGLVHISEIAQQRIDHPSDRLQVGQDVEVKILKIEKGGKRISLSMRALEPSPWDGVEDRLAPGTTVEGTVEKATNFGAFVEIEPGLTGLLPTSAMIIPPNTSGPRAYPPGKKVKVQIVSLDLRRRRISLAHEGSSVEGSRGDYQDYVKGQRRESGSQSFNALAAALKKIQSDL